MKTYSSLDLLGETVKHQDEWRSLWDVIKAIFTRKPRYVFLHINIPLMIYTQTKTYCETISEQAGETVRIEDFLYAVYERFISDFHEYQHHHKVFDLLRTYKGYDDPILVKSYQSDKVTKMAHKEKGNKKLLCFRFKRDLILKGEILLSEIDREYQEWITVERLIEIIWFDYMEQFQQLSKKKMIQEFLSIIR